MGLHSDHRLATSDVALKDLGDLEDLECSSVSSEESIPDRSSTWAQFSQFHPSNILAHSNRYDSQDWLSYTEDVFYKFTVVLTPSFLQKYVGVKKPEPSKLHAIAALDGLRGWACLLVFNFHLLFTYTWKVAVGWGFAGSNFGIHQLPIIHMLISGHIMVAIFFVISGYVLSYKPLKTIRSQDFDQTFTTLASSTFRRGMRLYIPSIVGLICVFVAVRLGIYNYSWLVIKEGHTIMGTNEQNPPIYETFRAQFSDLYYTIMRLADPFNWSLYYNNYNPHLWTIPLEFRCSLVVFLTALATSRVSSPVRMSIVSGITWFCIRYGRWDVVLFLIGMIMAEVDLINGTWEQSSHPASRTGSSKSNIHIRLPLSGQILASIPQRHFWIAVFVVGLYFGSTPNLGFKWTPGYCWIWNFTPKTYPEPHRFPQTIGAALIVFSVNRSSVIQSLFTNPISQYLGKISYAFYIVHGPILHALGYALMPNIWRITGKETNFQFCFGLLINWMICLPFSIWAADLFWRAVDVPSVKFARWVEDQLVAQRKSESTPRGRH